MQQDYQGLGVYQQPPRGRNRVVLLSILALVVVIGAAVTIILANRGTEKPAAPAPSAAPTTAQQSVSLQPRNAGWTVLKNNQASLVYEVPPDWIVYPGRSLIPKQQPALVLYSLATVGGYDCGGKKYNRGGMGAGTIKDGPIARSDLNEAATSIARAFSAEFYGEGAPAAMTNPRPVAGQKAVQIDSYVTVTGNDCSASKGRVSVLVSDAGAEYRFMVVNGDVTGGPASPPTPEEADLQKIVDSARPF